MKYIDTVPDKIYAGFDGNTHLESYCLEKKGKCTTEYIRKDALMEWLDGKMTVEGATEGMVGGYDLALKDVIDHINSM